jgi:hypothetical protein
MSDDEKKCSGPECECECEDDMSSDSDTVTTEDVWNTILPEYRPRVWITMDLPPWFVALSVYLFSLGIGMWKSDTKECHPGMKF